MAQNINNLTLGDILDELLEYMDPETVIEHLTFLEDDEGGEYVRDFFASILESAREDIREDFDNFN